MVGALQLKQMATMVALERAPAKALEMMGQPAAESKSVACFQFQDHNDMIQLRPGGTHGPRVSRAQEDDGRMLQLR